MNAYNPAVLLIPQDNLPSIDPLRYLLKLAGSHRRKLWMVSPGGESEETIVSVIKHAIAMGEWVYVVNIHLASPALMRMILQLAFVEDKKMPEFKMWIGLSIATSNPPVSLIAVCILSFVAYFIYN